MGTFGQRVGSGVVSLLGLAMVIGLWSGATDTALAASGAAVAVDLELTPSGDGYWTLDNYGRVQALGGAVYHGGSPALAVGESAVSLDPTPTGSGYWVFTSTGRVFAYGEAAHHGDLTAINVNGSIVDTAVTASGQGYWMLGSEGGIFAFGDADFEGSIQSVLTELGIDTPAEAWLNQPIVGLAPTPTGKGYWLVAADGGMFSFGDAAFFGSIPGVLPPGVGLNQPIVGLVPQGAGYLLVAADGGIFNFGDSEFHGSIPGLAGTPVSSSVALPSRGAIVAVTVTADRSGYTMFGADGVLWPFGSLAEDLGTLGSVDLSVPANPGNSVNCSDFTDRRAAQMWFDRHQPFHGDPAQLDADGDGQACESLTPAEQHLAFATHAATLGVDETLTISAAATSGLPVALEAEGACTIEATFITPTHAGSCTVHASQSGNAYWAPAPTIAATITITHAPQQLIFTSHPSVITAGETFTLEAVASSGLSVELTAQGVCTVNGNEVTGIAIGACTVTATQPGNTYWAVATTSTRITIAGAPQQITLSGHPGTINADETIAIAAQATSGLTVDLAAHGACTIHDNTIAPTSAGTCTITASQAGDTFWAPATLSAFIDISLAPQQLIFTAHPAVITAGETFTLEALASSGLSVELTAQGVCTIHDNEVTGTAQGTCTISATQPGDTFWAPALTIATVITVI